jgi:hypothetical protein
MNKGPVNVPEDYRKALANIRQPHRLDFQRDLRGADTDPAPPKAADQPGYSNTETFAPLLAEYNYVLDLPTRWRFWADDENVNQFAAGYVSQPDWDFNGWSWRGWGWIDMGDYYENLGHKFNGHAWYRTEAEIPKLPAGKKVYLHFAGITMHPVVGAFIYVNGKYCPVQGDLPKDSTVREFDITDAVKPGEKNVIVVGMADYRGPGGIYKRGVRVGVRRGNG